MLGGFYGVVGDTKTLRPQATLPHLNQYKLWRCFDQNEKNSEDGHDL